MPSIWKKDKIPLDNSLEKEVARLGRIILALDFAFKEKRFKHLERDLVELYHCHEELIRLINERKEDDNK